MHKVGWLHKYSVWSRILLTDFKYLLTYYREIGDLISLCSQIYTIMWRGSVRGALWEVLLARHPYLTLPQTVTNIA